MSIGVASHLLCCRCWTLLFIQLFSNQPIDLTLETWEPRFLWIPEHWMHIRHPRFNDAHVGLGIPQSTQISFPGMIRRDSTSRGEDIGQSVCQDNKCSENQRNHLTICISIYLVFIRCSILQNIHDSLLDKWNPLVTLERRWARKIPYAAI